MVNKYLLCDRDRMLKKKENSCTRSYLIGSLCNNDGEGYEKKTSRCLELYRAYSISFNPSKMLATFLDLNFKELYYIEVQEKKKNVVVLCSRPRQDVKLGTFTLQSCQDG